jgi:putative membrane protein
MFSASTFDLRLICIVASVGAIYIRAERRAPAGNGQTGRGTSRAHRDWFLAGLATILVALQGPIDAGAATSFSVHMVQHLLLTMVAAPLLVLGAPVTLAFRASSKPARLRLRSVLRSAPIRLLSNPLVAWTLFFGVLWGSHVTGFYEASLVNPGLHDLEHVAYLGTAVLFWMPLVARDPAPSRLGYPGRILYLFFAMASMAFLGLAIFSANNVLYPAYAAVEGTGRALSDQRVGGALMWAGSMVCIVPALAFVMLDWMRADEREARRIDERLLATPTTTREVGA